MRLLNKMEYTNVSTILWALTTESQDLCKSISTNESFPPELSLNSSSINGSDAGACVPPVNTGMGPGDAGTHTEVPSLWQLDVSNKLFIYVSPFLIICGTICNALSFTILQSRFFRRTPCSFLLSALAVADTGVLNTGLLRHWIRELTNGEIEVRIRSVASCKIHVFLTYLFPHLSSWTLMLMTIERAVSVAAPFKAKEICSQKRMILAWIICAVGLVGLNLVLLVIFDILQFPGLDENGEIITSSFCLAAQEYNDFFSNIWSWIDFAFVTIIPLILIIICNTIIIVKMIGPKIQKTESQSNKMRSTTMMLIALNVVFLLTNALSGIYFVGMPYWPQETLEDAANYYLAFTICILLYNINNAINFVLYCVSGTRFRRAMLTMFGRRKPQQSSNTISTNVVYSSEYTDRKAGKDRMDTAASNGATKGIARVDSTEVNSDSMVNGHQDGNTNQGDTTDQAGKEVDGDDIKVHM